MAKPLIDDQLWEIVEPLLPPHKPRRFRYPGRKPVDPRKALTGIVFVLKTGIPWEYLPAAEMGISGVSCWRKLREWQAAGVWDELVEVLLARLHQAEKINWERAVVDASHVRAVYGGKKTGPSPVDRAKAGSKHHILVDGNGVPLAGRVTKANRNEITQLEKLVDQVPPVRGKPGRPRQRPDELYADRGYDSEAKRRALRTRGIRPKLAKRKTAHGSGLGKTRWVVERPVAWLHSFRRLRTRFDRSAMVHQAFLTLGMALVAGNFL
jgi:transposase